MIIFVLGEENTSSVLENRVFSTPEHDEIVVMRFADDGPWLSLVEARVFMDVVTWLGYSDSWNCSNGALRPVVCVDPRNIILPYILDVVMEIPVMLARKTVVMRINTFSDPPFALDVLNTSEILLSIVLSNSAFHVIWLLRLAPIFEYTLSHFCESLKIRVLSNFAV